MKKRTIARDRKGTEKSREVCISDIEIRDSQINGQGVFATRKIIRAQYITALTGKLVTTRDVAMACIAGELSYTDPLQIDEELHLVLTPLARSFNHSCVPNTGIRGSNQLFALRDIEAGEEITYDYSSTVGTNVEWWMPCHCLSNECRGEVGNVLTIPETVLAKYLAVDLLPAFIKKQLKC